MADVRSDLRDARARRHRKAVVAAAVVVLASVVLGFGALIASDALRLEGGPGPALAEHATTPSTRARQPGMRCGAQLTSGDPLWLWIAGDSLAGSLGPSLGEEAGATGVVQPVYDSRVSSGLSTPGFFDWPERATDELARVDPDVVVFIVGANDWKAPSGGDVWEARYEQQVEQMLTILEGTRDTRYVYWIGSPTLREERKDEGAKQVNAVARRVVESHARASYVDAYQLFSAPDGSYSPTLPGPDGRELRVRTADGIHFTDAGADLLADRVYGLMDERCHVGEHAVEGAAKPVLRAKGSDGPGGGSGTSGGGSGGAGSSGTTPATVAPTTQPTAPTTTPSTQASTTTPTTEEPTVPSTPDDAPETPSP